MRVLIDGDGCPRAIKDLLFRAAEKRGIDIVIVANRPLVVPRNPRIRAVQVQHGLDVADDWLVQNSVSGELVITADLPLAAELVAKGATAISPRGETWTVQNVRERLSMRDFYVEARESGLIQGSGPPPMDEKSVRLFANAFDRWLTQALRAEAAAKKV